MKRYLTTPIYYASGSPHLGHAYTTLVADCYRRYGQLAGDDVLLATGTDEHGHKIERAARSAGMATSAFVDARSGEFERLWRALGIGVDQFERTTSGSHKAFAQAFWQRLAASGDLYRGEYVGPYCIDCEQYFSDGETCPVHSKPLETFREPSWFFRLSRYQDALISHIESHAAFIVSATRRNEVLSFLRGNALRDLSVSRMSTRWGVPVPGDNGHVMYVWIDALVSYLSALSPAGPADLDDETLRGRWAHTSHFIGKDILTFHAIYWPALLMSAGFALPESLVVNGWLTVLGRKIAKSDPETVINPLPLTEMVGRDGLRWYLLRSVSLGRDVDFSHEALIRSVNADLANNVGNLFSRFIALARKRIGPEWRCEAAFAPGDDALRDGIGRHARAMRIAFDAGNPAIAAREFVDAAASVNAFFQRQAPWQIDSQPRLATVLWVIYGVLCDLTVMGAPFIPDAIAKARLGLGVSAVPSWADIGVRRDSARTLPMAPLFPRVSVDL